MKVRNKLKSWKLWLVIFVVILVIMLGFLFLKSNQENNPDNANQPEPLEQTQPAGQNSAGGSQNQAETSYYYPMPNYASRLKERWFGKYVTASDTVPDCGAAFVGYHDGDDLEVTAAEKSIDVPVYAMSDGTIKQASNVSGYGGLLILAVSINGQDYTANYGHIRVSSVLPVGTAVKAGQKIAVLGTGCSLETAGERKHLHFAIHRGSQVALAGYVQTKEALSNWVNPNTFLDQLGAKTP